jgi:glycogen synthase
MTGAWGTDSWKAKQRNAMGADYSWDAAAAAYSRLYDFA